VQHVRQGVKRRNECGRSGTFKKKAHKRKIDRHPASFQHFVCLKRGFKRSEQKGGEALPNNDHKDNVKPATRKVYNLSIDTPIGSLQEKKAGGT